VVAALAFVADPTGAPADVAPYLAALPAADQARLAAARQLLGSWSFETPTTAASLEHPGDSAATALFNTWMHFFLTRAMQDEYTAASFDMWRLDDNFLVRVAYRVLADPGSMIQSTLGQPILCDDVTTPATESCTKVICKRRSTR